MNKSANPLEEIARRAIDIAGGWISLAVYMNIALQHPDHGYYRSGKPLGRGGDFITAPEISQVFGELIGLWCVLRWRALGEPTQFTLLELGPGLGTLLNDALRATRKVQGFHDAMHIRLVESSHELRAAQRSLLKDYTLQWHDIDNDALPPQPLIFIANEFFDALPVRQFIRTWHGWAEVGVGLDAKYNLKIMPSRPSSDILPLIPEQLRDIIEPNAVLEHSPQSLHIMNALALHIVRNEGSGLVIDYGYTYPPLCSTLQAISAHAHFTDFMQRTGEVDLSTHVDFSALAECVQSAGAVVSPIITQGEFLKNMGIDLRTAQIVKNVTPEQSELLISGLSRLTSDAEMGKLFKVLEIVSRGSI